MVKKFKKFMKKKGYQGGSSKSSKSYSKNPFTKKKCFECGEMGHISTNCKNKDENNSSKKKKFEGKKKLLKKYNKKKNGKACYVEWNSDTSMRNPPRRVLPILRSRSLHLYLIHRIV
jgi:hypothetical protein